MGMLNENRDGMYKSNHRSLGMTTAKSFGKGIIMGLVFFLPGVMVIIHWENINRFFNELHELPVITKVSRDFKSGFEVAGLVFQDQTLRFYDLDSLNNKTGEQVEILPEAASSATRNNWNNDSPTFDESLTVWNRLEIEEKLKKEFSKKKMRMVSHYLDYVEKYTTLAAKTMVGTRIPASISLAQGLLESDAGRSYLARNAKKPLWDQMCSLQI